MPKFDEIWDNSASPVIVRFAPSPTGDLHVGGVRTALFNWCYARHHGGKFLLRVEDTDRQRSTPEAIGVILDGLKWLGLNWDEEPVYQSTRLDRHVAAAQKLLDSGAAYRCFCTKEEIDARRQAGGLYMYDRHCLKLSDAEAQAKLDGGVPFVIRLRVPEGDLTVQDGVRGDVTVNAREIDDLVLLRSDGTPTYMLAVVVDDIDMGVTHIIRGDDHLSNTPKQMLIYRGLGATEPHFAHVPMILGSDKKKLSKRHGATAITDYQRMGYLPDTLASYLGLLGWSPGDDRNDIELEEMVRLFKVSGIQAGGAVFDEAKLKWLNGLHISRKSFTEIRPELEKLAQGAGEDLPPLQSRDSAALPPLRSRGGVRGGSSDSDALLESAWELFKTRIHFLTEFFPKADYLFRAPDSYDAKGVQKSFAEPEMMERLTVLRDRFTALETFDAASVETVVRKAAEEWGISAGKLIHPLRLAVSGVTEGPGLFELMAALGKEEVGKRMGKATERLKFIKEFSLAHAKYLKIEPRDAMYRVATDLINIYWGNPANMATGLGVLLLTWNNAFYRYGSFNYYCLEKAIKDNWNPIESFRNRDILSFTSNDKGFIKGLFLAFLDALKVESVGNTRRTPVGVAKTLHLLAPRFFPIWDDKIANSYVKKFRIDPEQKYIEFILKMKELARILEESNLYAEDTLKRLDEYNYVKYTKGINILAINGE